MLSARTKLLLAVFVGLIGGFDWGAFAAQLRVPESGCLRAWSALSPVAERELIQQGPSLNTTGDPVLDSLLGRALAQMSGIFGVQPGFAITSEFRDHRDRDNAMAVPYDLDKDPRFPHGTVLFGDIYFARGLERDDSGLSILITLAHEFAHIRQFNWSAQDTFGNRSKRWEVHADLLTGYYLGLEKRRWPTMDLHLAGERIEETGDTRPVTQQTHGSPLERIRAAEEGFAMAERGLSLREAFDEGIRFVLTAMGLMVMHGNPFIGLLVRNRRLLFLILATAMSIFLVYRFEKWQDRIESEFINSRTFVKGLVGEVRHEIKAINQAPTTPEERADGRLRNSARPARTGGVALGVGDKERGSAVVSGYATGQTKCGQRFDEEDIFAAHFKHPCGTVLRVKNLTNKKEIVLPVWDAAGSASSWEENIISLSIAAASQLGFVGKTPVEILVEEVP